MVNLLPRLLMGESDAIVSRHDSISGPFSDLPTKICLPALAHLAPSAESLHA